VPRTLKTWPLTTPSSSPSRLLAGRHRIPLGVKVAYSVFLCVLVPVYWHYYGPANFLWGSDIALFFVLASLWLEAPLPNSMMAIGVLPFEILWCIDLFTGARLLGATDYMFDQDRALLLRGLSLFHLALPVLVIYLLRRLGYDRRALVAQTLLTWFILPLTYLLTSPADNVNLVFGPGQGPQTRVAPLLYLALLMTALPLVVYWPLHTLMSRRPQRM
jgi:hypothetical protein